MLFRSLGDLMLFRSSRLGSRWQGMPPRERTEIVSIRTIWEARTWVRPSDAQAHPRGSAAGLKGAQSAPGLLTPNNGPARA